ncbi:hypothetical protein AB0H82_11205 [Streptomyces sp. NPDC050732]|uniref:hypothetical protein n=1 Tax=Streptomyces sp. NPDC050732 TaxID=3154632 RepID=UPI00342F0DB1
MAVFACVRCDAVLTRPVERVALPVRARQKYGHDLLPALMESGTYAVDPEPSGPPWRPWSEIGAEEAAARGVFAPEFSLSFGAPGAVVVAPGDTCGTVLIPERCDGYCIGLDGRAGPNLACAHCGSEVATRVDDCSYWQVVWFVPDAVRRVPDDGPDDGPEHAGADWEVLAEEHQGAPPIEPWGSWNARWEAAVGAALAQLLAVSAGARVALPDGVLEDTFGRALDALFPPAPVRRRAVLAGPGLPPAAADIAVVPRHPRTGEVWQPPGTMAAVPLEADVWLSMAFPRVELPVPVAGGMPDGVFRDDPLPPYPFRLFTPDRGVFLSTLARLPAVREPWLREIYDRFQGAPYACPF